MAKVHEYLLVLPDGQYEITKSNGPICFQQSAFEKANADTQALAKANRQALAKANTQK